MNAGSPVAVVTGAGSPQGIGLATARLLAEHGNRLVITSTTDRIQERAAELRALGAEVLGVPADLTDPAQAATLVQAAVDAYGRIDVLVNNAGMVAVGQSDDQAGIADTDDALWRLALSRNLDTMFFVTRAVLPVMVAAGYGRVVNVSSLSGPVTAYRGDVGYHAAKAGAVGLTRSVAVDTARHGITVNAVAPGWIATGSATDHERRMGAATPVGRSGTAEEVASLIGYLASPAASYVTGQVLVVDGGNSITEEHGAPAT